MDVEKVYLKKDKREIYTVLVLLKISFDVIYWFIIQNTYSDILILERAYQRNAFSFEANFLKYIISWLVSLVMIHLITKYVIKKDKPHEMLIITLFVISFLPNISLFALSDLEWSFFFWQLFFWSWFICFQQVFIKFKYFAFPHFGNAKNKINSKTAGVFLFGFALCFLIGSIYLAYKYYGKIYIDLALNTENVYDSRLSARGAFGTLTNYFRNNAMYVVLPMIAVCFWVMKRYLCFAAGLVAIGIVYSIDSQKAVLFLTFVSICAATIVRKKVCKLILKGILYVNVLTSILYGFTKSLTLVDYLFKRIYFLPAIIGHCHFEYVNTHQHVVFMSSLLSKLNIIKNYEYAKLGLPFVIGENYFGSHTISANTGAFAGAYDYGLIGLILIPVIYSILFKMLDDVCENIKPNYYMTIIVVMSFVIEGATLPSVILVYGFLVALLMLYLMRCTNSFRQINKIRIK